MTRTARLLAGCTLIAAVGLFPTMQANAAPSNGGVLATFEGRTINLAQSWGAATACTSDGVTTQCFRSVAEMDQVLDSVASSASISPLAMCTTSLRLYSGISYSGTVLQLSSRGTAINLSTYGFDNMTSSYQVGACGSTFYDGANRVAPTYPGPTGANAASSSMLTGWDNRVSSVYIA
jgi:hypothetical protein